ncbi:MAG: hypothetical protein RTU30_00815 [Candidatus Thorarchaeota archaeon]
MGYYCVMVHGPCRGKMCDFWARVKIRKRTVDELVVDILDSIIECDDDSAMQYDDTIEQYWKSLGVTDMERLYREEPDLSIKMKEVERRVRS